MTHSVHQLVSEQFDPTAASYAVSAVHADARALAELVALVAPRSTDVAIDVATGAGHVALAFAPLVARVVAYDLTPSMLAQTLRTAQERGLTNIETVQGAAEKLPFEDKTFDIYTVRLAPHHFADVAASVQEAARVLRPGGRFAVIDTTSPEDDELDRQLNEIEWLRDPSHVRNYRPGDWRKMVEDAGLEIVSMSEGFCDSGEPMDFDDWVVRMRTPADKVDRLRELFRNASPALVDLLEIRIEGDRISFRLPRVTLLATRQKP